ncbi:MAG: 6-phosphofructokinase [Dermatophilaceae bacterium]
MPTQAPPLATTAGIAVLTSGGDAQGMNAAVRAVVRTALHRGTCVYAVYEGYQGLVDGGERIRRMDWGDVGSIMGRGGTVIGTARCPAFRERAGMLAAARNLLALGIDRLVVIGGDGSLSGIEQFRQLWPGLTAQLRDEGLVDADVVARHPVLHVAGLVGSIDNDLVGTDMTIGTDSALHRIVEAIDAISSTAASHQRSFVVEVMGRHCGYLALMGAVAGGADFALVPEDPPTPGWEERMCTLLQAGRAAGRRDSIVVVAEGAADTAGNPITSDYVRDLLRERLGEDTRVTILGHVQRGGAPSAFDRWMPTLVGAAAVDQLLTAPPQSPAMVLGLRHHRVWRGPLLEAVEQTRSVATLIADHDYAAAMALRGPSFADMTEIFRELSEAPQHRATPPTGKRIAVMNVGGLAPGMNTAAWAAVRLGLARGHTVLGVRGSFRGLLDGQVQPLSWGDVEGWQSTGGAELGTSRSVPTDEQLYAVGRALERAEVDALLVVGGFSAYLSMHRMWSVRDRYPAFGLPIVVVPATLDNNLPGWESAIGADTALNVIVESLDRVKQSANASRRCFVVETMGRYCGYLAMMAAIATGAERVYLHEDGITLHDLQADVERMKASFRAGRRFYLTIRSELANPLYTTDFLAALFAQESEGLFDVRTAVLGHVQQGGNPSPFDRVLATRLTARALDVLDAQLAGQPARQGYLGLVDDHIDLVPFKGLEDLVDWAEQRPKDQWWLGLRAVLEAVADTTL